MQCHRCNRFRGGEPLKYRRAVIRLYGEGIDTQLEDDAMEIKTFSYPELEVLKAYYKERIRQFELGNYEIVWRDGMESSEEIKEIMESNRDIKR